MPTRSSSLGNNVSTAVDREIGSQYDNVKTVAENIESVVTVADHINNVDTVATNIVDMHAVGGSIVDVRTVAANIDNVVAVGQEIANVNTVAANVGNIDMIVAEVIPNIDEITNSSADATIATTKASEASVSAANALISENNAEVSEIAAKTSETNAKNSEIIAVQKASDAAVSAASALASEQAAAAMLDAFDDIYLGSFVVDPVTDNDGQPLLDGALYFNTSTNVLKVYDVGTTTWYTIPQTLLSSLLDVQLTSTTVGDMLSWNGTKWVNTSSVQEHITDMNNPHSVTKAQVGLENVDNTADVDKNVLSATKWTTARTVSSTGDVTWEAALDGSVDATGVATLANSGVTAGTYNNSATAVKPLVIDAKGRVTDVGLDVTITPAWSSVTSKPTTLSGYGITDAINVSQKGVANGVATLDASGLVPVGQLPSYVDDVLEYTNLGMFPAVGEPGKIYVALDTNKTYRWSGTAYIYITSGAVDSVAGKTGVVSLVKADVGLSNVDNTSDLLKPISTATAAALALKAPLASPALTGTPTAPTAAVGTSTTQLATTAFVNAEIANDTYSKADVDARVVHKTGNETIEGIKTFSSSPIVPTPTTNTQATNKAYADLKVALASFTGTNVNLNTTGYQKLPSGLIIQWGGTLSNEIGFSTFTYPIVFPNAALVVIPATYISSGALRYTVTLESVSTNNQRALVSCWAGDYQSSINGQVGVYWLVIGY